MAKLWSFVECRQTNPNRMAKTIDRSYACAQIKNRTHTHTHTRSEKERERWNDGTLMTCCLYICCFSTNKPGTTFPLLGLTLINQQHPHHSTHHTLHIKNDDWKWLTGFAISLSTCYTFFNSSLLVFAFTFPFSSGSVEKENKRLFAKNVWVCSFSLSFRSLFRFSARFISRPRLSSCMSNSFSIRFGWYFEWTDWEA